MSCEENTTLTIERNPQTNAIRETDRFFMQEAQNWANNDQETKSKIQKKKKKKTKKTENKKNGKKGGKKGGKNNFFGGPHAKTFSNFLPRHQGVTNFLFDSINTIPETSRDE